MPGKPENLVSLADRSPEQRREIASAGGKARAAQAARRRNAREMAMTMLAAPVPDGLVPILDDAAGGVLACAGEDDNLLTRAIAHQVAKAATGDLKALEFVLELTHGANADAMEQEDMTRQLAKEAIASLMG